MKKCIIQMEVDYEEKDNNIILYLPNFKQDQSLKIKIKNGKKINKSN